MPAKSVIHLYYLIPLILLLFMPISKSNRLTEAGVVGEGEDVSSSKRILTTPAVPTNSLLLNTYNIQIF